MNFQDKVAQFQRQSLIVSTIALNQGFTSSTVPAPGEIYLRLLWPKAGTPGPQEEGEAGLQAVLLPPGRRPLCDPIHIGPIVCRQKTILLPVLGLRG